MTLLNMIKMDNRQLGGFKKETHGEYLKLCSNNIILRFCNKQIERVKGPSGFQENFIQNEQYEK